MGVTFPLEQALVLIEKAIKPFPRAALFELADSGFTSTFQQLVACMISVRTLDEVTIPVARRLLGKFPNPADFLHMDEDTLTQELGSTTFARTKAKNMLTIARLAHEQFGGELPCEENVLLALPGIGPKCAHLILGIAGRQPYIGVDIHVHRVTNRWGYVATTTPEKTLRVLEEKVPEERWIDINRLLMPFGKHICTGRQPKCPTCVLREFCPKIGVTEVGITANSPASARLSKPVAGSRRGGRTPEPRV